MNLIAINHPHAQTAVLLASFNERDRDHVATELRLSGCPRNLYTLACVLRAATSWERPAPTGREALEDKFNSNWAEKKRFILADEVLARAEMFHVQKPAQTR